jgi:hypothetical protein
MPTKLSSPGPRKAPVTVTTFVEPLYLNKPQLAQSLPASERSIDNWKKWGWIPYLKIGGMIRYDLAAVRAALEKRFIVHAQFASTSGKRPGRRAAQ